MGLFTVGDYIYVPLLYVLPYSGFCLQSPNLCKLWCYGLAEINSMRVNYTRILLFFNSVLDIAYTWLQYELFTGLFTDVSLQILQEIGHFCLTAWSERSFVRPLILSMIQRVKLWYTTRAVVSELLEAEFFTIDYDKDISHLQECLVQCYWRSAVLLLWCTQPGTTILLL